MERLQEIEEILHEALRRDPVERDAYLREACHGDNQLQREVSSLLANHSEATDSKPWVAAAAAQLIDRPRSLQPGESLGPYRIESFLAAGGMGEVYRATDTRLNRPVAIKISAAQFRERFEREARVIASLNHPHICQLYDVGPNYLVMELVEGPTLADRIRRGALPLDDVLGIAHQIAEALEAAHEKGRVHRDLKPANVKITPQGVVKLLDFGLAKAAEEPPVTGNVSDSPTQTISATRAGVILGTAAYMSPEQARGAAVDKRADIWAFGCVLYEMLSGRPAFQRETTTDILAAVLKEEPDWSRIPANAQPLVRRCLVKDPKHRLRDIGDAMPLLEGAPAVAPVGSPPWPWIAAAVFALAFCVAGVGWWRSARPTPLRPLMQLSAELPPDTTIERRAAGERLAISPDGMRIVVAVHDLASRKSHLATRRLDQSEFKPLSGAGFANRPFFSADGQWIAFFADGKLKRISVQGGSPVTLCDAPNPTGGSWGDDDKIVAALNDTEGILSRISASGGAPTPVTALDKKNGEIAQLAPQVLPGSQAVMFTSRRGSEDADIDVLSFKTGERKTIHRGGFSGRYLATSSGAGYLVFMHQDTLFAAPFDLRSLAVTGTPQPVLEDVAVAEHLGLAANFDCSRTGTFVYASGKGQSPLSIFWLNGAGEIQPLHLTPGSYRSPRLSPDGKRLVFEIQTGPLRSDIWVKDLERDTTSRLTSLPGENLIPVWTPDGRGIVFEQFGSATPGMYWIRVNGSGEPLRLTKGKPRQFPNSFSPDGKWLAFEQLTDGRISEIWTASVEGDREHPRLGKAEPFVRIPFYAYEPTFSPDGRWLAYHSNETGRYEVYVRPFLGPGGRHQISIGGGIRPIWSRHGQELFFLDADRRIMVVRYAVNGDSFVAEKPRVWSARRPVGFGYDVAPDGKRVAALLYADGTSEAKPSDHVTVLLNFFDELLRRAPARAQ
jgi:serine/threonine-protein kinase